jgi:hypothetical protein
LFGRAIGRRIEAFASRAVWIAEEPPSTVAIGPLWVAANARDVGRAARVAPDGPEDLPMKSDALDQLKKILGAYDHGLAKQEHMEAVKRAADAAFPLRFETLKAETIRPAMKEFVDILNGYGHEATVREQDESSSSAVGVSSSAISLLINPKPFARKSTPGSKNFVEITFSGNRSERKVIVSSTNTMLSSNGRVGKRAEYDIDAMTSDVVADHVLQTLQDALK